MKASGKTPAGSSMFISVNISLSPQYMCTYLYNGYKRPCNFPQKVFEQEIKHFPSGWNNSHFCQPKQGSFKFYTHPTACSLLANNLHAGNISIEGSSQAHRPALNISIMHVNKQTIMFLIEIKKDNDKWGLFPGQRASYWSVDNLLENPVFWQIAPD